MTEAISRFMLIDQSVKKPGGHHYEYAQRILDAARAQGYETLLIAHREYRGEVSHEVRPAFTRTFWDNYRYYYMGAPMPAILAVLGPVRAGWRDFRRDLKRRLIFSSLGLAVARARYISLKDMLLRPYLPDDASFAPTGRPLLILAHLALVSGAYIARVPGLPALLRLARLAKSMLLLLLGPFLAVFSTVLLGRVGRANPATRLANEFMRTVPEKWDFSRTIIFVPNATAAELDGLALIRRADHEAARGHWAFLYRRPVLSGYPAGYKQQMEAARRHRMELARLKTAAPEVDVHFYTDTEELTAQYDLLGVYRFATLPVPVELLAARPTRVQGPLVIGYLGDARDEKGFQHLPKLVESSAPRQGEEPKARFLFQANFNVPEGEPGSRYALGLLAAYGADFVELAHGPFDSMEYNALLNRMDIVIIPYLAANYSARSSGVLMEALSAGLPVLVPAYSWMARLIEPARQRHFLSLFREEMSVAEVTAPYEEINNKTLLIDARADHLFIRLTFDAAFDGYVRIAIRSINKFDLPLESMKMGFKAIGGEVIAVFRKPHSAKLWWKAEPIEAEVEARPREVEMRLYHSGKDLPLGAGAMVFDQDEDIARSVGELCDFYAHHKRAAEDLRDELRPLYDPAVLVEKLGRDAFGEDAGGAVACAGGAS